MGQQDGVTGISHKEVCILRIGLMYVLDSMYFHYLLLFVIHILSLDQLWDPLLYLNLSMMSSILAKLLYVC